MPAPARRLGPVPDPPDDRVLAALAGELRCKPHAGRPADAVLDVVCALVAAEAERVRGPERASEQAVSDFVHALLERRVTDRDELLATAAGIGLRLDAGGSVIVA